jgi:plasmid stability protein
MVLRVDKVRHHVLSIVIAEIGVSDSVMEETSLGQVLVRNLDDHVIETYKTRARLANMSLEQFLREQLVSGAVLTPTERTALARQIRARTKFSEPLTKDEIREGLE